MASYKGRWPLGRGFERFYGFLGGESNSWYPDLVHDNHQIDPPATPEKGYHLSDDLSDRAIEFIRDAKVVDPDKPFFLYLAPQAGHAPHHVPQEWADRYKGRFDEGYEAIRQGILDRQKELGLLPQDTELSPINPHGEPQTTGPDGQPWPLLDTVRPWDSLSADEQRLFARMAEVFAGYISYADDRLGRVDRLPRGVGPARQHDHRRDLRQRRQRRGRPERVLQRVALLQRDRRLDGHHARAHRRARKPAVLQPLQHRLGVGVRHPVPVLEALGGVRGRHRRHVPGLVAGADPGAGRAASAVRPRGRRRAHRVRAARHRAACGDQGLRAEPDRGRELRRKSHRRGRPGQDDAVLRDARAAGDLPRGLARLRRSIRRSAAGGSSSRTSGSSTTWPRTARSPGTSRGRSPSGSSS